MEQARQALLDARKQDILAKQQEAEALKAELALRQAEAEAPKNKWVNGKKEKGTGPGVVLDTLLDIVEEVARKIEEMMPGDQGGSVEEGKVNLAAFAKGCFSTDGFGGYVDVMKVAGIE